MGLLQRLWNDEAGVLLSAETVVLGTVGVLGATIGLNLVATSINEELKDVAYAFRSLDQSYSVTGHRGPGAHVAGSSFTQEPVEKSLKELRQIEQRETKKEQKRLRKLRKERAEKAKDKPQSEFYTE